MSAVRVMTGAALLALLLAPGALAQVPVLWEVFERGPVRTWEYRVFARKPEGHVEVIERVHCRPNLTDSAGCVEAMGVARLSHLKFKREFITSNAEPPAGRGPAWEINGYVLDCTARAHRHVFKEFYGESNELLTRADYPGETFEAWDEHTARLGRRACG